MTQGHRLQVTQGHRLHLNGVYAMERSKRHVSHRRNWLGPCRKRGRLPGYDNYERR